MNYSKEYLEEVYKKCSENGEEAVKPNRICGCFFCGEIFGSEKLDKRFFGLELSGKETATCPYCGTDTVLYEDGSFPITEELLEAMHRKYFVF